jgi:hypothetical protein
MLGDVKPQPRKHHNIPDNVAPRRYLGIPCTASEVERKGYYEYERLLIGVANMRC